MSASDLPLAELSQHSPPRRLKFCIPPPAKLYTIIEEEEDQESLGASPVSIYEDLDNYEIEDRYYYDQGKSQCRCQSGHLADLIKGSIINEDNNHEVNSTEQGDLQSLSSTATGVEPSAPRPLPEIPHPLHEAPRLFPQTPRPLPAIPHPLPAIPRSLPPISSPATLNMDRRIPKPGPAKLGPNAGLEEWLEEAKQCHYLPESVMKQLCEIVKACLMEGWPI